MKASFISVVTCFVIALTVPNTLIRLRPAETFTNFLVKDGSKFFREKFRDAQDAIMRIVKIVSEL